MPISEVEENRKSIFEVAYPKYTEDPDFVYYNNGNLIFGSKNIYYQWLRFNIKDRKFSKLGKEYENVEALIFDITRKGKIVIPDGEKGNNAWLGGKPMSPNNIQWNWKEKKYETKGPKGYRKQDFVCYRNSVLISFCNVRARKGNLIQAYNKATGKLLWEKINNGSIFSFGWGFEKNTVIMPLYAENKIKSIDLATRDNLWEIKVERKENSPYGVRNNKIPYYDKLANIQHTKKGWIIAFGDGILTSITFDGIVNWSRKDLFRYKSRASWNVKYPAIGGDFPLTKCFTLYKDKIYVLGSWKIHCIDYESGQAINTFSLENRIIGTPVFYNDEAILLTKDKVVIVDAKSLELKPGKTEIDQKLPFGISLKNINYTFSAPIKKMIYLTVNKYNNSPYSVKVNYDVEYWARKDDKELLVKKIESSRGYMIAPYYHYLCGESFNLPLEKGKWEFYIILKSNMKAEEYSNNSFYKEKLVELSEKAIKEENLLSKDRWTKELLAKLPEIKQTSEETVKVKKLLKTIINDVEPVSREDWGNELLLRIEKYIKENIVSDHRPGGYNRYLKNRGIYIDVKRLVKSISKKNKWKSTKELRSNSVYIEIK